MPFSSIFEPPDHESPPPQPVSFGADERTEDRPLVREMTREEKNEKNRHLGRAKVVLGIFLLGWSSWNYYLIQEIKAGRYDGYRLHWTVSVPFELFGADVAIGIYIVLGAAALLLGSRQLSEKW